jgi:hypothetical protein
MNSENKHDYNLIIFMLFLSYLSFGSIGLWIIGYIFYFYILFYIGTIQLFLFIIISCYILKD